MLKKLVKLIVLLLVLVIAGGIAVVIYVDQIAKAAIEKGGTFALGVETTVDSADVGIAGGEFTMKGLTVANPAGFDSPHFLNLRNTDVEVSLGTLMGETVELPQLRFGGLDVNLQKHKKKTNYGEILDNLKRFESSDTKGPDESEGGKRFIVEKIVIRNVQVHADLMPEGGDVTRIDLPIDRIVLRNVGSDTEKGLLLTQLSKVIVQALIAAIVEKGGDILPAAMIGDLRSQLAGLTDLSALGIDVESTLPDNIGEILKKQGLDMPDLGDIGGGIGDLLGGGDDGD